VIAAFAVGYLWLTRRPIDRSRPAAIIGLAAFTALIFLLWSRGWSPQWATLIIPFILLTWPAERGLRWVLLLTAIVFIEWPLADALKSQALLALAIVARTVMWIVLAKKTSEVWRSTPEV
jgi:hypothetical protein